MSLAAAGETEVEARMSAPPGQVRLRHRHPLAFYVLRRLVAGAITVFIASILIFLVINVLPGNVAQIVLGRNATPGKVAAIEHALNQGQSPWQRYFHFLGNFITGHFGYSTAGLVQSQKVTVGSITGPAFLHSAELAAITMILFIPMMLTLGLLAGLKAGSARDTVISVTSLSISALPEFLVGTLLIVILFDKLGWLPPVSSVSPGASPLAHPSVLVLPVATLLLVSLAFGSRLLRASVAEIVSQDYVTYARIHGYSKWAVTFRYVLPNALPPTIQIVAQQLQYLIGGLVVVESVFNYPGLGTALVNGITVHDVQIVMVMTTLLATVYILINVLADLVALLLDPRVRTTVS